jgi:hypothetical protein
MIPYLEGRIGRGWSDQLGSRTSGEDYDRLRNERLLRPLLEYFRRSYPDTALSGSAIGIRCGLESSAWTMCCSAPTACSIPRADPCTSGRRSA